MKMSNLYAETYQLSCSAYIVVAVPSTDEKQLHTISNIIFISHRSRPPEPPGFAGQHKDSSDSTRYSIEDRAEDANRRGTRR